MTGVKAGASLHNVVYLLVADFPMLGSLLTSLCSVLARKLHAQTDSLLDMLRSGLCIDMPSALVGITGAFTLMCLKYFKIKSGCLELWQKKGLFLLRNIHKIKPFLFTEGSCSSGRQRIFFLYKLRALSLVSHIDFEHVNIWGNTNEWSRCFSFCQKVAKTKGWSKKVDLCYTLSTVWTFLFWVKCHCILARLFFKAVIRTGKNEYGFLIKVGFLRAPGKRGVKAGGNVLRFTSN